MHEVCAMPNSTAVHIARLVVVQSADRSGPSDSGASVSRTHPDLPTCWSARTLHVKFRDSVGKEWSNVSNFVF